MNYPGTSAWNKAESDHCLQMANNSKITSEYHPEKSSKKKKRKKKD